ncbi:MAG: hypothetical protein HY056_09520 [Proteobacteria bacterium]|nr:hypothetical protein [Pseudomonadota bacterium]
MQAPISIQRRKIPPRFTWSITNATGITAAITPVRTTANITGRIMVITIGIIMAITTVNTKVIIIGRTASTIINIATIERLAAIER